MKNSLFRKWFPKSVNREDWADALSSFYADNAAYHAMTSNGDKGTHPQVQCLLKLIESGKTYAEIGCGGGLVCGLVGETANVQGFDISPIAIESVKIKHSDGKAEFHVAPADAVPLQNESVDGVYSFEVLEHLWDPVAALREMVRIVKPGGFILVSCPNHFSLDLQINKNLIPRGVDVCFAWIRYVIDRCSRKPFINLEPDIMREDVYPDCDMISTLLPCNIPRLMQQLGCPVKQFDTFFMCSRSAGTGVNARLQQFSCLPFIRWFGDHVFMHAIKPMSADI